MLPKITKFYDFMRMNLFRFFINMNLIISILAVILQANDEYEKYP